MRAIWSGSINFGLVNIPVKLFSAVESRSLDLHMLRRQDLCPIRFARVCRADGKEVPWEDIVKGYEYNDGDYVVLEKEDFEHANVKKTQNIEIHSFVKEREVDTIYFNKPYYLEPQKSGIKAYAILREALKTTKMVAVASFVVHQREHLAVIKSHGDLILLDQLHYYSEIRSQEGLHLPTADGVTSKELKMAKDLIMQLSGKFDPKTFHDTYIEDLKKLIEAKAKGKKIKKTKAIPTRGKVTDIMSLLKQSIKDAKKRAA